MAVQVACPAGSRSYGLHLMSDNGSQPTSGKYENHLKDLWIEHATTSYCNPKGNADTERMFRTIKEDYIWLNDFTSFDEAVAVLTAGIEEYNVDYPHSALDGMSPNEFEQICIAKAA